MKHDVGSHRNSINAWSGGYPNRHQMNPLMRMLAHIGYVLCDILEVLEEKEEGDV